METLHGKRFNVKVFCLKRRWPNRQRMPSNNARRREKSLIREVLDCRYTSGVPRSLQQWLPLVQFAKLDWHSEIGILSDHSCRNSTWP